MMDGSDRVTFDDVEVASDGVILSCRVGKKVVWVPPRRMLPGTTVARRGDRGRLVLSREVALNLGLVSRWSGLPLATAMAFRARGFLLRLSADFYCARDQKGRTVPALWGTARGASHSITWKWSGAGISW